MRSASTNSLPLRWSNSCWKILACQPSSLIWNLAPVSSCAFTFTMVGRSTSPRISNFFVWKERQPSSPRSVALPVEMTRGLHRMYSFPCPRMPSGLNTISCTLTPTCGAASPTPSSWYITSSISAASFFRSSPKVAMRPLGARSTGLGYFSMESSVRGDFHSSLVTSGANCFTSASISSSSDDSRLLRRPRATWSAPRCACGATLARRRAPGQVGAAGR
mmetsp:Transcript_38231/g.97728  ORF Transcript_38231/g.97728 Transcript_38231/m.97728 type:complete len:219 (-) Transcript_38231:220-876(-)